MVHDGGDVVVLEETDGGDTGGSGCETGGGIFWSDSSQGEHRNVCGAGLAQPDQACGVSAFLFENWSEDGEGRIAGCGLGYFCWGVTRDCDQRISW